MSAPGFFFLPSIFFCILCVFVCVSTRVCFCVKETDRSSAAGDHSPETFISHYPERERAKEGERGGGEEDRMKSRGKTNG